MANRALIVLDVQSDFLGNTLDYMKDLCQQYVNQYASLYKLMVFTTWVHSRQKHTPKPLITHAKSTWVEKTTYSGLNRDVHDLFRINHITEVDLAGVDTELSVLATMFSLIDTGYEVRILERLVSSYHGRNWEAMMIARHALGDDRIIALGGSPVYF